MAASETGVIQYSARHEEILEPESIAHALVSKN